MVHVLESREIQAPAFFLPASPAASLPFPAFSAEARLLNFTENKTEKVSEVLITYLLFNYVSRGF